ncbi:hypothetical protein GCM10017691_61450 [Pseudonocardia petroleophila]|uniref:ATP-binding protein n=1 Tax=Pseudonocardia petroleophila TaxID=37331 RepID=A0A7G7MM68_9PSEU|nr:ATP-binding protein [Pseudonocardia petroleophila]QNG53879.1 ATP-binding protein [Pseudonocardia petroleophila]
MSEALSDDPATAVPGGPVLSFGPDGLAAVRHVTREGAAAAGLAADRVEDLVLAVNEAATNAIEHGGGSGTVRCWTDGASFVVEVRSPAGPPLHEDAGRTPPDPRQPRGRGLWLMRHLTDRLEIEPGPVGSTVRMRVRT